VKSHQVTVVLRPAPAALARVVSVLHARGADVRRLTYDGASVVIEVVGDAPDRLASQLGRLVEVVSVDVATGSEPALAVAS